MTMKSAKEKNIEDYENSIYLNKIHVFLYSEGDNCLYLIITEIL